MDADRERDLLAEIERLKDALDRQAAHYGGALSIEKARADAAERERDEARAAWRDSQNVHTAFCDAPATRASRDRLLDALRKIAEAPCNCEPYQDGQHRHDCQRISWMVTDAADALKQARGEE